MCFAHFLCKRYFFNGCRVDRALDLMLFPYADRGKQGADPDSGCSQVVDFVNLQGSINLVGIRQDLSNLICCDCIQSAAERIQLDQIQIIHCFHIICRSVEPGMVHPLVHDV